MPVTLPEHSAHWSKNFVEHLRTVHFTLIGTATALLVMALTAKPYNASIAATELRRIEEFRTQWGEKLVKAVGHYPEANRPAADWSKTDYIPVEAKTFFGATITQKRKLRYYHFVLPENRTLTGPKEFSLSQPPPETLSEFSHWWDQFLITQTVRIPVSFDEGTIIDSNDGNESKRLMLSTELDGLPGDNTKTVADTIDLGFQDASGTLEFAGLSKSQLVEVHFPVTDYIAIELSNKNLSGHLGVPEGSFRQVFRDAQAFADDAGVQKLSTLEDLLVKQGSDSVVFEAFGIKFPADLATFGGMIVLLSVQLYFFVYLRKLSGSLKPEDPGWDVPWIGMDSTKLGETLFVATVVALPVLCLVLVLLETAIRPIPTDPTNARTFVLNQWRLLLRLFLLVIGIALSTYLGTLCQKYRPQLTPSTAPEQASEHSDVSE